MTDESHDPTSLGSATVGASSPGADETAAQAGDEPMAGWGEASSGSTWAGIDGETEPSEAEGRHGRRPTSYGLPPITQRSSDLRAAISDMLTTKAPAPISRLAARVSDDHSVEVAEATSQEEGDEVMTDSTSTDPAPRRTSPVGKLAALTSERPELVIGAAFVSGLVLATILKRLARR